MPHNLLWIIMVILIIGILFSVFSGPTYLGPRGGYYGGGGLGAIVIVLIILLLLGVI